ncbi:MAG: D-alanyl-D-alanine carboxypeptidase [Bacilli bacterium]|nr:D-alanyl-D-alanine carboxypeptidase [Bacilli bacterium]
MKKTFIIILAIIFLKPFDVLSLNLPSLHSNKILLYDADNKIILHEQNSDQITSIASLTKIVTTIVAIENIKNLEDTVEITSYMLREVPYDASIAGLKLGDKVSYRDLLYASILPSGADATIALAHSICGNTEKFVEKMNEFASRLDLKSTQFKNVTGYDAEGHHSTLKEVLKILTYSLQNDLFETIYKTRNYRLSNGLNVSSTINIYNKFLNRDTSSILGSKTGFTNNAGVCMSALFESNGKNYIIITTGAEHAYQKAYNLEDTLDVIDYLDKNYVKSEIFVEGTIVTTIPVVYSKDDKYEIKTPSTITKYIELPLKKEDIKVEYDGIKKLTPLNKIGDKIGTVKYYFKDSLLLEEDVYLNREIKFSIKKFFFSHYIEIISTVTILILFFLIKKQKSKTRKKNK